MPKLASWHPMLFFSVPFGQKPSNVSAHPPLENLDDGNNNEVVGLSGSEAGSEDSDDAE